MTGGIIIIIIIAPTLMKWCSGKSPIPSTARRLPYLPQPEDSHTFHSPKTPIPSTARRPLRSPG